MSTEAIQFVRRFLDDKKKEALRERILSEPDTDYDVLVALTARLMRGQLDAPKNFAPEDDHLRTANALQQAALSSDDTLDYDVLVKIAVDIMRENTMMPDWLASFTADVLEGKRKRPTKRGSDKYANWVRDYALCLTVHTVANKFNLPKYTNNELSAKTTAANIVSEAVDLKVDVVITACKKYKWMIEFMAGVK